MDYVADLKTVALESKRASEWNNIDAIDVITDSENSDAIDDIISDSENLDVAEVDFNVKPSILQRINSVVGYEPTPSG